MTDYEKQRKLVEEKFVDIYYVEISIETILKGAFCFIIIQGTIENEQ